MQQRTRRRGHQIDEEWTDGEFVGYKYWADVCCLRLDVLND